MIWHIIIGLVVGLIAGFAIAMFVYSPIVKDVEEAEANLRQAKAEIDKLKHQIDEERAQYLRVRSGLKH